jgi:hypothetical protein
VTNRRNPALIALAALLASITALFAMTFTDPDPVAAPAPFNRAYLVDGRVIDLPPGMRVASIQFGAAHSARTVIGPGSRVDILAVVRVRNKIVGFVLSPDALVVAVGTLPVRGRVLDVLAPPCHHIYVAVNSDQYRLIPLANSRGCALYPVPHDPGRTATDADHILKLFAEPAIEPDPPPRLKSGE